MISRSVRSPRSNGYSHHEQTEPNAQRDNPANGRQPARRVAMRKLAVAGSNR